MVRHTDRLLPLKTAAKALGVKAESLRREADGGRIPFSKIGDEYLFPIQALERSLISRAKKGVAHA